MINIQNAVNEARKYFGFKEYAGNIFEYITQQSNYIEKYSLLILKEDIGKLSGFIGYPNDKFTVICINYKRSLGHQNFTLAHELGHYFLHHNNSIDDENIGTFNKKDPMENEADRFASMLLYPDEVFINDYKVMIEPIVNDLDKLSDKINELCHKYCVSYEFMLRKICYKAGTKYEKINNTIKRMRNNSIGNYYDKDFYLANSGAIYYQRYTEPYKKLKKNIDILMEQNKIGKAMGESIIYTNELMEE